MMIKTGMTFEEGKKAAELILEKIKDPASPNHSIVLDAEIKLLVYRPYRRKVNEVEGLDVL